MPEEQISAIKTKERRICEGYCSIHVPCKYKKVIERLSRNNGIIIMKQDKESGVVIMNKPTYHGKYLELLNTDQFTKLNHDLTKKIQAKIQRVLRKIKTNLTSEEYSRLYPSGSSPGKFCGKAKIHKILPTDNVDKRPIKPIVSNINTSTNELAKYLAKLFSPLSRFQYTVNSTKHFVQSIKHEKIPAGYQMISFDIKSLFTGIALDKTIEIILQRIYNRNEITTQIRKKVMKELLLLCTREVHFAYSNEIYLQNDGVAMRSCVGPILAGIFMLELETSIIRTLGRPLLKWKRYVDDTFYYVKIGSAL